MAEPVFEKKKAKKLPKLMRYHPTISVNSGTSNSIKKEDKWKNENKN